ncbi:MAG: hypothetical protein GEV08_23720 [Acidimicrobiia bacterium]|nr:hypothetical protein [Acidimicrobiia bacterium]
MAFVLHDLFAVPFDKVAAVLGRSTVAAKKLASRARQQVHGSPPARRAPERREWEVVEAFLAAARGGDLDTLLQLLAPGGRLLAVVTVTVRDGQVAAYEVVADAARLEHAVLYVRPRR